jgi:NAD(P)-dependent dehydrogenase (short-subunit alcohol dehydrogenase family)
VGGIDVLIVNGAQMSKGRAIDSTVESLQQAFDVNVLGAYRANLAFLPLLRARKTKKIINISSTAGSNTLNEPFGAITSTHAHYNVSKVNFLFFFFHCPS